MVAVSFQRGFIGPILSGRKRQTIRQPRKDGRDHCKPGDQLQLYFGLRTKHARKFADARCTAYGSLMIDFKRNRFFAGEPGLLDDYVRGFDGAARKRGGGALFDAFAQADGFADWEAMKEWWKDAHGLALFEGKIIRFADVVATGEANVFENHG